MRYFLHHEWRPRVGLRLAAAELGFGRDTRWHEGLSPGVVRRAPCPAAFPSLTRHCACGAPRVSDNVLSTDLTYLFPHGSERLSFRTLPNREFSRLALFRAAPQPPPSPLGLLCELLKAAPLLFNHLAHVRPMLAQLREFSLHALGLVGLGALVSKEARCMLGLRPPPVSVLP
jgi:hypothetical protein